ncbi:MAG: hypothetical protein LBR84_06635 [Tannerella sp.]|jgi:hypothetical protein|nr:hypothetical protein [Tannerella sp.]
MRKSISLIVISGVLTLLSVELAAQNGTNSPYTRYGYGELANSSFGAGRSMGGIGVGLRSSRQINPMNPASYSCMDSMTFLFDFGASGQISWYSDGTNSQHDFNGNVEYMAMQFPILKKRAAMSIGLMPFSHVGYKFGEVKTTEDLTYTESFEGYGGLNQLFAGLSIELWKKRLSLGANLNYLFGTVTHSATSVYSIQNSTYVQTTKAIKIKNAALDFGMQYVHPLSKNDNLIFGLTFSPKTKLGNVTYETTTSTSVVTDTISGLAYDLPTRLGFGTSFVRDNKLIVALDATYQKWSEASFGGRNDGFNDRLKIAAGAEWIPNFYSRPYLNRMKYRAGINYSNSYIIVKDKGYNEIGATLGVGFPITDQRSFVNVSFEYVKIRPEVKTMINENYFRLTLSYTFNEFWFFKMKLD